MLVAAVPVGRDDDEGRGYGGLGKAEKEAGGGYAGEAGGAADGHLHGAPSDDCGADERGDAQAGEDIGGRVLGAELAEVEEGDDPGELLAVEGEVLAQAEYCGVVDGALVEVCEQEEELAQAMARTRFMLSHTLEEVYESHQGEDDHVQLADKSPLL